MNNPNFSGVFLLVGIVILSITGVVLLLSVAAAVRKSYIERRESTIVDAALGKITVMYRMVVYLVDRGAFIKAVYENDADSIFKVAQYAPPNFDYFESRWTPHTYGLDNSNLQYFRNYRSDDGKSYCICVTTADGFWPVHATQYLDHL